MDLQCNQDELLGVADAGRVLGVGPQRVRNLERDGRLPALRTVGGVRLFRRADVERLAREREASRAAADAR